MPDPLSLHDLIRACLENPNFYVSAVMAHLAPPITDGQFDEVRPHVYKGQDCPFPHEYVDPTFWEENHKACGLGRSNRDDYIRYCLLLPNFYFEKRLEGSLYFPVHERDQVGAYPILGRPAVKVFDDDDYVSAEDFERHFFALRRPFYKRVTKETFTPFFALV